MNQEKQPEALILADECAGDWEAVRPHLVVQMLRDQHAVIESQRTELVAEAARTAEEKLRADQMTDQHRMQCNIRADLEARCAHIEADTLKIIEQRNELAAQLSAIGAGGVESLRKPSRELFDSFMTAAENSGVTHLKQIDDASGYQCADCKTPLRQGYDCGACGSFEAEEIEAAAPAPAGVAVPESAELDKPWQHIDAGDLDAAERMLMGRLPHLAAFIPRDAHTLANISLHCIREVRAARVLAQEHATQLAGEEDSSHADCPDAWLVYAKGTRRYWTVTLNLRSSLPEIYKGGEVVPLYRAAHAWRYS